MQQRNDKILRHTAASVAQRGMTLIEIMIVIMIMASIATAVSLAVMKRLEKSRIKDARMGACTMRSAVQLYMADHPRQCPSLEDLMDGYLDSKKRVQDPWNQDYTIECEGDDPDVYSAGPDGEGGKPIRCEKGEDEE